MKSVNGAKFRFGDFELDPARRSLTRSGELLALNSKTFDLLCRLVENHGTVVTKDELLEQVWPGQFVEENNLTVQISALRKVFRDKGSAHPIISTIPGKGYSFVADVIDVSEENEIVIEERSVSRIVIEDLYDETNIPDKLILRNIVPSTVFGKIGLVSVAAVLIVAAVIGFFYAQRGANADARGLTLSKITSSGDVTVATITPDGKYAVFGRKEKDGESLWLRQIASGSQQQVLSSRPVRFVGLTITPDGNSIYATTFSPNLPDPQLWRLPLLGGVIEEIGGIKTGAAVSFSPDGKQMAFTESRSSKKETQLLIANYDGTDKRALLLGADDTRSFPNFSG